MNAHQGSRQPRGPTPEALAAAREMLAADQARTQERLTGLVREFGGIVESARADNADDEHDPEGATIAFERQHIAALIDQAQGHLIGIEAALRRLDEGGYGICATCHRPIPAERLAARPTATMCVACASRRDS